MKQITITLTVPNWAANTVQSVAPVMAQVRKAVAGAWIAASTWGMHPAAPAHAKVALRRAKLRGGVRI